MVVDCHRIFICVFVHICACVIHDICIDSLNSE